MFVCLVFACVMAFLFVDSPCADIVLQLPPQTCLDKKRFLVRAGSQKRPGPCSERGPGLNSFNFINLINSIRNNGINQINQFQKGPVEFD